MRSFYLLRVLAGDLFLFSGESNCHSFIGNPYYHLHYCPSFCATISRVYHIEVEVALIYKVEVLTIMAQGVKMNITEAHVKEELAKEGWDVVGEFINAHTRILVRNYNCLNGHLCWSTYHHWREGKRPDMRSLVNPTEYVKEIIGYEGWELISDYKNSSTKFVMRNKAEFMGEPATISWNNWQAGKRPDLRSLLNRDAYIKKHIESRGWEFLGCKSVAKNIIISIRNPRFFNGATCEMTWYVWQSGSNPDFRSIKNKSEYIKTHLKELGYFIQDSNWEFQCRDIPIKIGSTKHDKTYSVFWHHIASGKIPNSPKTLVFNRIKKYLKNKKTFSISEMFDEDYWNALSDKFDYIPPGMHLDHIICMSLWGNTWEQMRLANDPSNLRLLTAKENLQRNNRLKASELDEYDLWDLYYQAENPKGYKLIEDRYDIAS